MPCMLLLIGWWLCEIVELLLVDSFPTLFWMLNSCCSGLFCPMFVWGGDWCFYLVHIGCNIAAGFCLCYARLLGFYFIGCWSVHLVLRAISAECASILGLVLLLVYWASTEWCWVSSVMIAIFFDAWSVYNSSCPAHLELLLQYFWYAQDLLFCGWFTTNLRLLSFDYVVLALLACLYCSMLLLGCLRANLMLLMLLPCVCCCLPSSAVAPMHSCDSCVGGLMLLMASIVRGSCYTTVYGRFDWSLFFNFCFDGCCYASCFDYLH